MFTLILFALIPIIILGITIREQVRKTALEATEYIQIAQSSMLVNQIESHIDRYIFGPMRTITKFRQIYDYTPVRIGERLDEVRNQSSMFINSPTDHFLNIAIRRKDGTNILYPEENSLIVAEWRDYIANSIKQDKIFFQEFRDTDESNIYDMMEKSRFVGLIDGAKEDSLYFTGEIIWRIESMIFDDVADITTPIFITDETGKTVYTRNVLDDPNFNKEFFRYFGRKAAGMNTQFLQENIGRKSYFIYWTSLDDLAAETNLKWNLYMAIPKQSVFSKITLSKQTILIISVISLITLIILGFFFTAHLIRPIEDIIKVINKVREGDFEDNFVYVNTGDEIQELAEGFNMMIEVLKLNIDGLKSSAQELDRKITELTILHDLGKSMNSTLDLERLLNTVIICVVGGLKFDRAVIFLVDDDKKWIRFAASNKTLETKIKDIKISLETSSGVFAKVATSGEEVYIKDVDKNELVKLEDQFLESSEFFVAPLIAKGDVTGVLAVDNAVHHNKITKSSINTLMTFANSAALAISNARLYASLGEKERLEQEMLIGYQIQTALMPRDIVQVDDMTVVGRMMPAREIGGDYFDFITDNGHGLNVVIGDVAGKGVPAGLIMAMARSIVRSVSHTTKSTKQILTKLNKILSQDMEEFRFMTMLYLIWEPQKSCFRYTSAGHERMIIYRAATKSCELNKSKGVAIGLTDDIDEYLDEENVVLQENDAIVLYTDGVTDAVNMNNQQYSLERLMHNVASYGQLDAPDMLNALLNDIQVYSGSALQFDDITLVVLKRKSHS